MQNKKISSKIENILFKFSGFFIRINNEALMDSKLENPEQIKKVLDKIEKQLAAIEQRITYIKVEAENLFKLLDSSQKLLEESKSSEIAEVINNRIVSRQNMIWDKIREGLKEESRLKERKKELIERENNLNRKLKEINYYGDPTGTRTPDLLRDRQAF